MKFLSSPDPVGSIRKNMIKLTLIKILKKCNTAECNFTKFLLVKLRKRSSPKGLIHFTLQRRTLSNIYDGGFCENSYWSTIYTKIAPKELPGKVLHTPLCTAKSPASHDLKNALERSLANPARFSTNLKYLLS